MSEIDVLFSSSGTKDIEFEFKGTRIVVKVREISWSEKNKILSKCFNYQSSGQIAFDFDAYNKDMFKKLILEIKVGNSVVPASEINDVFFARLNSASGSMLEKLIPRAFEEMSNSDFFAKG